MTQNQNIKNLLLTSTENMFDEVVYKTTNTVLDEMVKSIPFASVITTSIDTYKHFKILKEQKQLLAFVQKAENIDRGFIEKFFQDKNNTEIGLEILGILDQTYLEKQAKMIGRVTLLWKNRNITKKTFDQYTYVITRLNCHLISLIEELYVLTTNKEDPEFEYDIKNPNLDLVSFGFLKEYAGDDKPFWNSPTLYERTDFFYYFFEHIFKDAD